MPKRTVGYRVYRPTYADRQGKAREAGKWAVEFPDHTDRPRPRRLTGFTDYTATVELGQRLARLVSMRAAGREPDPELSRWLDHLPERIRTKLAAWEIIDPQRFAARRTLAEHVADYEAKLKAARRSAQHVRETIALIRAVADDGGFTYASEINADAVNRFVNKLRDAGKSTRRINAHVQAIKSLTRWLVEGGKLHADPLASVKRGNVATDRRLERRALSRDEYRWLVDATHHGPERCGMPGPERALLYAVAIQTGLRAGELRSLTRGDCRLKGDAPHVLCRAKATKNAKPAQQYLRGETAEALREHLRTKAPAAPAFTLPDPDEMAGMIRADLHAARTAWLKGARHDPDEHRRRAESDFLSPKDSQGRRIDFHALRYTCGAWLAQAGVHPKRIQRIMRHSSITLTMDTYGHLFPGEEAGTVEHFGDMTPAQPLRATGTADATPADAGAPPARLARCLARSAGRDETGQDSTGQADAAEPPTEAPEAVQCYDTGQEPGGDKLAACPSGLRGRIANPLGFARRGFESRRGLSHVTRCHALTGVDKSRDLQWLIVVVAGLAVALGLCHDLAPFAAI